MKISFLLHNAYGIGGTIRSTFNIAGALAERGHAVEIVSLMRTLDTPSLPVHQDVRLRSLIDSRPKASAPAGELIDQPGAYVPGAEAKGTTNFNALTDQRVAAFLAETDADVVIATRPGLVIYLATFGLQGRYLRVGQEHRLYGTHRADIRTAVDAAIPRLDAYTAVSEADAATHREQLPGIATRLTALPNAVPAADIEPSDGSAKLVVAAGRLIPVKRYDLLVSAWDTVSAERPDWKLRIYGRGPQQRALRAQIDELDLGDHITLMGAHTPIETEWAKGSIAAVTSREESFGMTIVEAMHCGVPVVATDCPHGPGEIIKDGEDGLLVPVGDCDAIAAALLKLIYDDELRTTMGESARVAARRYAPDRVAAAYEDLFAEVYEAQGRRPSRAHVPRAPRVVSLTAGLGARVRQLVRKPPLRPIASSRVDAEGGLVILVDPTDVHGTDLTLTLTRRHKGDIVSVPLRPPTAPGAPWTALLERRNLTLPEGRWDLNVIRPADGTRRRVTARYAEGRGLVHLEPVPGRAFSWWIPYPTVDGWLAVRTWHRPAHAEAGTIHPGADALDVEGTLYGATFTPGATVTATATPRTPAGTPFTAHVTVLDETRFRVTVPYARVHAAHVAASPVWDLALLRTPADTADTAIRIGRVLGDIVDRNKTDLYPTTAGVRPYLTMGSGLAVTCPEPDADGRPDTPPPRGRWAGAVARVQGLRPGSDSPTRRG